MSDEPYRYELSISVIVSGDGLDQAMHRGNALAEMLEDRAPFVVSAHAGYPGHRNDLDRALAVPDTDRGGPR